jgi:hypothetical protein
MDEESRERQKATNAKTLISATPDHHPSHSHSHWLMPWVVRLLALGTTPGKDPALVVSKI